MLTGRLIHRAVLSIVIIAGVGLAAEVFGADKAGDKPAARMPEPPIPLPASLTPASPEAPPLPVEGLEPAGAPLPGEDLVLPGEDTSAPAAKTDAKHPATAHARHRHHRDHSHAGQARETIIKIGGSTLILAGSNGGNLTITVEPEGRQGQPPIAAAAAAGPAHELAMRPLPSYRIEPPDVINIDLPRLVPLPPYRAAVYDVLMIHVSNALSDQPIDGYFMVEADGVVNLGPAYGTARVKGLTLPQAKKAIEKKLDMVVHEPEVSVQLARVYGSQQVSGQYLVGPDGTINLRSYGLVRMTGLTVPEAQAALEKHLAKYLVAPELSVDVVAFSSKVYYVITQGAGLGDNVRRFPITGNETVLDAISQINGLSQLSSTKIWISRPSAADAKKGTILPVDWKAITQRGATASNYQILPGDRVFIAEDHLVTLNNDVSKAISPAERVLGFIGLLESTIRGLLPTQ